MKQVIRKVYLWDNEMVMVFDRNGQQMPDYQGRYSEVRDNILKDAPKDAEFFGGEWRGEIEPLKNGL